MQKINKSILTSENLNIWRIIISWILEIWNGGLTENFETKRLRNN